MGVDMGPVPVQGLALGALVHEAELLVHVARPLVALEGVQGDTVQWQLAKTEVQQAAHGLSAVALIPEGALGDADAQLDTAVQQVEGLEPDEPHRPRPPRARPAIGVPPPEPGW